ncbi:MAG: hypothetical protein KF706_03240 [Chitinophagales bacterium]|nr:hypothetical protein [Chitinophagales bacterium]HRP39543.1 hypothetical protein [Chitinophagales bacterium]
MRFFVKLLVLSLLCAVAIYLLETKTQFITDFINFSWLSLMFLIAVTLVSFYLLQIGLQLKGHSQFMQYFGAMFGFKVFASLLFVCYFIFVEPITNKHFALVFFALYGLFTGLLVSEAWQILKEKKEKKQ